MFKKKKHTELQGRHWTVEHKDPWNIDTGKHWDGCIGVNLGTWKQLLGKKDIGVRGGGHGGHRDGGT